MCVRAFELHTDHEPLRGSYRVYTGNTDKISEHMVYRLQVYRYVQVCNYASINVLRSRGGYMFLDMASQNYTDATTDATTETMQRTSLVVPSNMIHVMTTTEVHFHNY